MTIRTNSYSLAIMGVLAAAAAALPATRSAGAYENKVSIRSDGDSRMIRSNGIPEHAVGEFPNRGNPNAISEQNNSYRVPLNPVAANRTVPMRRGMNFGVALNGVPFDPGTAEFWRRDPGSGWRYEALSGKINLDLDRNNAHVQPNGAYHYHGLPKGMMADISPENHSPLMGYAADGFPIYGLYGYVDPKDPSNGIKKLQSSWRLKSGTRDGGPGGRYDGTFVQDWQFVEGAGDLDESNARFTVTPDHPKGTHAYFLTEGFPFIPRSFVGTPDNSFRKGPPGGGAGRHGRFGGPRHGGPPGVPQGGRPPPWERR